MREAFGSKLLKADSERKHGDERGDADGDAERGERVAKDGFAQIAEGEIGEVARLSLREAFRAARWRAACRRP